MKYVDPNGHESIPWGKIINFLVGRAWNNGGLNNADWIEAANTYVPANHKGANFSSAIAIGLPNGVGTVFETNMVTTSDGQYQIFVTPSVGAVSPQASFGLAQGYIEGNFDTPSQFSGIALQAAGGFNMPVFGIGTSADIWMGLDGESNPSGVWGWDVTGSVGVGPGFLSGSMVVSNAIPFSTALEDTFTALAACRRTRPRLVIGQMVNLKHEQKI